jgi:NDP-sugar pyrophosphorylase family protein
MIPKTKDLYIANCSIAYGYISSFEYPWQALSGIGAAILRIGAGLDSARYDRVGDNVWIAKSARVAQSALISGPCIIDEDAEVRHCAFVRGSAIVGKWAVVGNSTELKNCILFDGVQVPHYNYVGDSILGYKSHMGAGAITSNVKSDKTPVIIKGGEVQIATGLKKCGAFLGDFVEVGCGSVLNPGTVIGARSSVYPLSSVRGVISSDSIYKHSGEVVERK